MASNSSKTIDLKYVKNIAKKAKKDRSNRCYYEKCFEVTDLYEAGLIHSKEVASCDQVVIAEGQNESIEYYGFDLEGNHVRFSLSIISLYPKIPHESNWRLAEGKLHLTNVESGMSYSYETKQLIDYSAKRLNEDSHESKGIYKVGSLSLEIINPHSLARIFFNGSLKRVNQSTGDESQVSARISISTHPTCDKFDYRYLFCEDYLAKTIVNCRPNDIKEVYDLLGVILANRIDQAMMFQVHFELLHADEAKSDWSVLWGAKFKEFLDPCCEILGNSEPTESLLLWVESGLVIVLCRPIDETRKNLVYGWVHNSFDYAGFFEEAQLMKKVHSDGVSVTELRFDELKSFSELSNEHELHLRSFKAKNYKIEVAPNGDEKVDKRLVKVTVNDFPGWGIIVNTNRSKLVKDAKCKLWTLKIDDEKFAHKLASESLLGGKGNSLIELNKLSTKLSGLLDNDVQISVPRGTVVSCAAYDLWLQSNPIILQSINNLDDTRRALAARSIYTNPLSDKYVGLAQSQQILREQCLKTCLVLKACPLPPVLRRHLRAELVSMFGEIDLRSRDDAEGDSAPRKCFAVRSSAVGEDSTETSAAGQMRTFLGVVGFDHICHAIVECWTSQFQLEAITYKTQNGLDFNLPMAVVVQELIDCKAAGVATTCNPLTGSTEELQILANPGLGEGVVSGKSTDTVIVPLSSLVWNSDLELYEGQLTEKLIQGTIKKQSDSQTTCCLSDEQIISLSNLLLALRRFNEIRDREIEWGITEASDLSNSSSSSSSDSSARSASSFQIHLLQSRPLTHLHKLNSNEIDHELDYGISSPLDLLSRANLGEVMPGALCPLNSTFFHPLATSMNTLKPFESHHTRVAFASEAFAFYGQMSSLIMSYSDSVNRFTDSGDADAEMKRAMMDSMIGTALSSHKFDQKSLRFFQERRNPNSPKRIANLTLLLLLDSKAVDLMTSYKNKKAMKYPLYEDLRSIEEQIENAEKPKADQICRLLSYTSIRLDVIKLKMRLFREAGILGVGWVFHIRSTLLNMALNAICLKLLSEQPAYPTKSISSPDILHDFSILVQGDGTKPESEASTESCDMSKLLSQITQSLFEEGELNRVKSMDERQLYEFLSKSTCKSALLFRRFVEKNGHRAYKEFDFATLTYSDDPSSLMKLLVQRVKRCEEADIVKSRDQAAIRSKQQQERYNEVLAKIEKSRFVLLQMALPRARNAVIRRERSKSYLIKMIHKYRQAFRYLGALLCLLGRLPSADLIFWLTVEEIEFISECGDEQQGDLSRILYRARRRQQRSRAYNNLTFPVPTMEFAQVFELFREFSFGPAKNGAQQQPQGDESERNHEIQVTGIVTEVGGIVSHGAVVAREYGIPTLCTAMGACSKFKTGQTVTLDATQGVCYLAKSSNDQALETGVQNPDRIV